MVSWQTGKLVNRLLLATFPLPHPLPSLLQLPEIQKTYNSYNATNPTRGLAGTIAPFCTLLHPFAPFAHASSHPLKTQCLQQYIPAPQKPKTLKKPTGHKTRPSRIRQEQRGSPSLQRCDLPGNPCQPLPTTFHPPAPSHTPSAPPSPPHPSHPKHHPGKGRCLSPPPSGPSPALASCQQSLSDGRQGEASRGRLQFVESWVAPSPSSGQVRLDRTRLGV